MKIFKPSMKSVVKGLALTAVLVALQGCGPGTVYVGVSGPGPWVGYPPGGYGRPYPGGYYGRPGYYGRGWYSPNDSVPQGPQEWQSVEKGQFPPKTEGVMFSKDSALGRGPETLPACSPTPEALERSLCSIG